MSDGVFIAGIGAITSIGNNVSECLTALEAGQAGMADIHYLETIYRNQIPVAEVKLSNEELAIHSGLASHISRTALLSSIAAKEALADTGIENYSSLRTGLISATTVGGIDKTENFYLDFYSLSSYFILI